MKAVIIGALAASAFAADTITYPGTYKVASKDGADPTKCCYPVGDVTVTQDAAGKVNVAWTFDTCVGTDIAPYTQKAISAGNTPIATAGATKGDVVFTDTTAGVGKSWTLDAPTSANGDFILDLTSEWTNADCKATLNKKPSAAPSFPGVYTVANKLGTVASCCYPTGDVIVRQDGGAGTTVNVAWTFDTCASLTTYSGKAISGGAAPAADTYDVTFTDTTAGVAKSWTLDPAPNTDGTFLLDLGSISADCSATLTKTNLPTVKYPGVYEVGNFVGEASKTCCYPAGDITVTQDSSNKVTVGWTYENTDDCHVDSLKGKTVSGTATAPDSVTKDVTFTDTTTSRTYTLEYPATATGAFTLDLSSVATGCGVILDDKSGYVLGLGSLVALSLSYIMF